MKQIWITGKGGCEVLKLQEADMPEPDVGQVTATQRCVRHRLGLLHEGRQDVG